ncbi:response regulator transcription factor [Streptomyces shenzhenensis]|uniref:response regulator n=1 Tax=Streptomyces shenzhenensis TaxID=943815 RepID=UPI00367B8232
MFRSALRAVRDTRPDLDCLAEAPDGRTAIAEVTRLSPAVAILDLRMQRLEGLLATEAILAAPANVTKVLLSICDSDAYVHLALRAGASGFLLKSVPPGELIAAVRVAAGRARGRT